MVIKKCMARYTDMDTREKILKLHNSGYRQREIARRLYVSPSTVNFWLNKQGNLNVRKRTGRRRKTTKEQDDEIYTLSTHNPFLPATDINRQLQLHVSAQTIRNRLTERGLENFKAAQKPFLSDKTIEKRLQFALEYRHWTPEMWRNVIYADEKTFQSFGNGIVRVWRPKLSRWDTEKQKKERVVRRFHESVVFPQRRSGRFSVPIWGCIGRINEIHLIKAKTLNRFYYKKVILRTYFPKHAQNVVLVQDNARVHTAKIVREWLEKHNIKVLKFPPYSPDLNPIENLWGKMEHKIRDRNATSKEHLWDMIKEAWDEIIADDNYIKKLLETMTKRLEEVYQNGGKWVKY